MGFQGKSRAGQRVFELRVRLERKNRTSDKSKRERERLSHYGVVPAAGRLKVKPENKGASDERENRKHSRGCFRAPCARLVDRREMKKNEKRRSKTRRSIRCRRSAPNFHHHHHRRHRAPLFSSWNRDHFAHSNLLE